jgi:uncharacterized protein
VVKIKLIEEGSLERCTLITGFHGLGQVGYIAVRHIVKVLSPKRIGVILTKNLPPFITVENGKIILPFEVYKKDKFIIVLPHIQPYRRNMTSFMKGLVKWAIMSKIEQAVLIGGVDNQLKRSLEEVCCVLTETFKNNKGDLKLPYLNDWLFVAGPLALMLGFSEIYKFPAAAILAFAERYRPDPKAAAAVIETINRLFGLKVNTTELVEEAEKIEQEIETSLKQYKIQELEEGSRGMYI